MAIRDLFAPRDLEAIREATARAESRSAGEVVTYVVGRCDDYEEASWLGALLGALGAGLAAALWHHFEVAWGYTGPHWIALPPLIGAGIGYGSVRLIAPLERALIRAATVERRVARRAAAAFVEEEIFDTRDRTGIMIFLAHFEHRVVVLRDAGINAKVEASRWDAIADGIARGIREGEPAAALLEGLEACGALLEEHGVERRADDVNELDDEVRFHDR